MEKGSCLDASLDDWEFLPDHKSFMEIGSPGIGHLGGKDYYFDTKLVINMNYFPCQSHPNNSPYDCILDHEETNKTSSSPVQAADTKQQQQQQLLLPPLVLLPDDDHVHDKPVKEFKDIGIEPPPMNSNQEVMVPKVTVDPSNELDRPLACDGEGEEELKGDEEAEDKIVEKEKKDQDEKVNGKPCCLECIGFSVGKWRVGGIGALCSAGVAAATLCIFLLGGRQQHQHPKIQFQIYADDKGIKQVVRQASRLNKAMSAVRGAPATRASISFGGSYDGF